MNGINLLITNLNRLINGITRLINGWGFRPGPQGRRMGGVGGVGWGGAVPWCPRLALQPCIEMAISISSPSDAAETETKTLQKLCGRPFKQHANKPFKKRSEGVFQS